MAEFYEILWTIEATCKIHEITTGKLRIGYDNDQVVRNGSLTYQKIQQKLRHVD